MAELERLPEDQVARILGRVERFYFRHVDDPVREAAFLRRLGRSEGELTDR